MSTINKIKIENTVYNIEDIDARNELKNKASMTDVTEYIEEHKEEIKGFIDEDVAGLENLLRDILLAIQNNESASMTIDEIEQLIVSYFETKSVEEVEQ